MRDWLPSFKKKFGLGIDPLQKSKKSQRLNKGEKKGVIGRHVISCLLEHCTGNFFTVYPWHELSNFKINHRSTINNEEP